MKTIKNLFKKPQQKVQTGFEWIEVDEFSNVENSKIVWVNRDDQTGEIKSAIRAGIDPESPALIQHKAVYMYGGDIRRYESFQEFKPGFKTYGESADMVAEFLKDSGVLFELNTEIDAYQAYVQLGNQYVAVYYKPGQWLSMKSISEATQKWLMDQDGNSIDGERTKVKRRITNPEDLF